MFKIILSKGLTALLHQYFTTCIRVTALLEDIDLLSVVSAKNITLHVLNCSNNVQCDNLHTFEHFNLFC